jgi:hypothetical protein
MKSYKASSITILTFAFATGVLKFYLAYIICGLSGGIAGLINHDLWDISPFWFNHAEWPTISLALSIILAICSLIIGLITVIPSKSMLILRYINLSIIILMLLLDLYAILWIISGLNNANHFLNEKGQEFFASIATIIFLLPTILLLISYFLIGRQKKLHHDYSSRKNSDAN